MGRTLTATFTFVSDIFVHFCRPPSKRRAIYPESANPRREVRNSATKKGPLAKPPQESRARGRETDARSFFCFISTQLRLLCESSALLQPQTASPPPPSSTGSTTASLWLTGDGGATEGQPVCAPPRRLLGKEKPVERKYHAGCRVDYFTPTIGTRLVKIHDD